MSQVPFLHVPFCMETNQAKGKIGSLIAQAGCVDAYAHRAAWVQAFISRYLYSPLGHQKAQPHGNHLQGQFLSDSSGLADLMTRQMQMKILGSEGLKYGYPICRPKLIR